MLITLIEGAWDDIGTQRFYYEEQLTGCYGVMSPDVIKNVCAICHKIDKDSQKGNQ